MEASQCRVILILMFLNTTFGYEKQMARRRELKSIASGIAAHCVSRNNDIDGYWALGIIYEIATELETDFVSIDITSNIPVCSRIAAFRRTFRDQFGSISHDLSHFITGFIVDFRFELYAISRSRGPQARATCTVHIIDDLGRRRSASAGTFCYIHDPQFENKSTRG